MFRFVAGFIVVIGVIAMALIGLFLVGGLIASGGDLGAWLLLTGYTLLTAGTAACLLTAIGGVFWVLLDLRDAAGDLREQMARAAAETRAEAARVAARAVTPVPTRTGQTGAGNVTPVTPATPAAPAVVERERAEMAARRDGRTASPRPGDGVAAAKPYRPRGTGAYAPPPAPKR